MDGNKGNPNPLAGRLAQLHAYQDQHQAPLAKALAQLEKAMNRCEALLEAPVLLPETICRTTHALAISAATVLKLVHGLELDARLREVEEKLDHAYKPRLVAHRS